MVRKKADIIPVADLGEGPGGPDPPLFWVKKEEMAERKMAAMASILRPAPPPPLPLSSRSGSATEFYKAGGFWHRPRYKYRKKCSKLLSRNSHKIPKFLKKSSKFLKNIIFFSNVNLTHFGLYINFRHVD